MADLRPVKRRRIFDFDIDDLEFMNLGLLALGPCHAVAYDMQSEMSIFLRLLAVHVCLLANILVF